ncbi:unnamed protein product, partial [Staurois parvus]
MSCQSAPGRTLSVSVAHQCCLSVPPISAHHCCLISAH